MRQKKKKKIRIREYYTDYCSVLYTCVNEHELVTAMRMLLHKKVSCYILQRLERHIKFKI